MLHRPHVALGQQQVQAAAGQAQQTGQQRRRQSGHGRQREQGDRDQVGARAAEAYAAGELGGRYFPAAGCAGGADMLGHSTSWYRPSGVR